MLTLTMTNTTGDVPLEWYREEEHVGYDVDGRKLFKRDTADSIEKLISSVDDPLYWRRVQDRGVELTLSQTQLEMMRRLGSGVLPKTFPGTHTRLKISTNNFEGSPLAACQEPKRRFIPSKWEAKVVLRLLRAFREPSRCRPGSSNNQAAVDAQKLIWGVQNALTRRLQAMTAPKAKIPTHGDSYNPPCEYRSKSAEELPLDSSTGQTLVAQRVYDTIRKVPSYSDYVADRFRRCLDLYLSPRIMRQRLQFHPTDILPSLPSPEELKPFPNSRVLTFKGHLAKVISISLDDTGQWLLSGSSDCTLRKWEVLTGRCVRCWHFDDAILCAEWCPRFGSNVLSACVANNFIIQSSNKVSSDTTLLPKLATPQKANSKEVGGCSWIESNELVFVCHETKVEKASWHSKGDYFATIASEGNVIVHRLSRKASQQIFRPQKVAIQSVLFHQSRPCIFICTRDHVYLYDLRQQCLVKRVSPGKNTSTCIAAHAGGDNFIVGGTDGKLKWFDADLSRMPHKVLTSHAGAIRSVAFHKRLPLFASVSDDSTSHIFYGLVHSDMNRNALIVPLRVIRSHELCQCEGVLDCIFHPYQPWFFSAGADRSVVMHCDY